MDKPEKIDNYNHLLYSAITISIGVFMAALATVKVYVNVFHDGPYSTDPAVWGQLGDYIGGVLNPVIGLATLFMLLINIRLQQKELQNSKIELHDTKLAMDIQAKEMKVQNIEQSFFSMLSNYRSQLDLVFTEEIIGSAFNHNQQRITVTGRRALNALWKSRMAWSMIIDTIKNKYQSEEDPKLPLHDILNAVDQPVGFGDCNFPSSHRTNQPICTDFPSSKNLSAITPIRPSEFSCTKLNTAK
ncbi:hypothetical protein UNDKW_3945 [Undibacterium sp. KW1]|uniref:hypothetical protein n=1 Tax=Undibacterium sp. KW1 TaxID=2058624 RepID=UPI001331F611|nr:hypothetical protein [Undibacterium sp. KW1]BBB62218.1 hypothetical protein UNDKW_3945 [Undibacterium sp. KW1]